MIGFEDIIYVFVCGAMLTVSALGLESAVTTPSLSRWEKRFFSAFFSALALCSASFFLELAAFMQPELAALRLMAYFIQSLCGSVAFPMLAVYLLHCCGEDWRRGTLTRIVFALWAVFIAMLVAAQFSNAFWEFGADGQVTFGPAYNLLVAPFLAMQLVTLVGAVRRRAKLPRWRYRAILVCLVPVTIAVVIHMFIAPALTLIDFTLTLSVYSAYRSIVSDAIEQSLRQQRQIANQSASIAVLQMRPHFIYNTMTTVYYLCDQNPELAKQVTMDFTTYLRKNLAAIAGDDAIPFSDELEHARAYLAVEQAQFEDELLVSYDMPHTRFRVPPLTLQPLVENAVKHGMDPDAGPLHIWIQTRKTSSGSEIVVEDDGPGFDPAIADDPHTTLANIKERLRLMCDGRMSITPREGGGASVLVTIPHQE